VSGGQFKDQRTVKGSEIDFWWVGWGGGITLGQQSINYHCCGETWHPLDFSLSVSHSPPPLQYVFFDRILHMQGH
jgi:hypothetical protein